jgi:hypothetical protein
LNFLGKKETFISGRERSKASIPLATVRMAIKIMRSKVDKKLPLKGGSKEAKFLFTLDGPYDPPGSGRCGVNFRGKQFR